MVMEPDTKAFQAAMNQALNDLRKEDPAMVMKRLRQLHQDLRAADQGFRGAGMHISPEALTLPVPTP